MTLWVDSSGEYIWRAVVNVRLPRKVSIRKPDRAPARHVPAFKTVSNKSRGTQNMVRINVPLDVGLMVCP